MWINTYTARLFLASFVMRGFLHQIMLLIHQLLVSAHRFAVTYDFHQLKPFPFICFLSAHMFSAHGMFFFFFKKWFLINSLVHSTNVFSIFICLPPTTLWNVHARRLRHPYLMFASSLFISTIRYSFLVWNFSYFINGALHISSNFICSPHVHVCQQSFTGMSFMQLRTSKSKSRACSTSTSNTKTFDFVQTNVVYTQEWQFIY